MPPFQMNSPTKIMANLGVRARRKNYSESSAWLGIPTTAELSLNFVCTWRCAHSYSKGSFPAYAQLTYISIVNIFNPVCMLVIGMKVYGLLLHRSVASLTELFFYYLRSYLDASCMQCMCSTYVTNTRPLLLLAILYIKRMRVC